MTVYAIYQRVDGTLVSVGSIIADPLPVNLDFVILSPFDAQGMRDGTRTWHPPTLSCTNTPVDPAVANESTIDTYLSGALVTIDTIVSTTALSLTQADLRVLQQQVKDLARIERRIIKKMLRLLDTAT